MEMAEENTGAITIVEVKGRIDTNTAKAFEDRLVQLIKSGRSRLVVDLKQIIYISSAGFRALLLAGQLIEDTKGSMALCSLSSEVQRLFDIGKFTEIFSIYGTREDCVAKLS